MTALADLGAAELAPDGLDERGAALWAALSSGLSEASRDALAEMCRAADARAAGAAPSVSLRPGWPAAGLVGCQEPRIASRPWEVSDRFGSLDWSAAWTALDLADLAARHRPPWQDSVITDGMACRADEHARIRLVRGPRNYRPYGSESGLNFRDTLIPYRSNRCVHHPAADCVFVVLFAVFRGGRFQLF